MKLNKRYIRNIRENRSFYISATFLTIATLLMFYMFHIAGNAILDFSEAFYLANQLEDAHFTTYVPIPDDKLTELEETYDLTLEKEQYRNIKTDGTTARVFKANKKLNLYEVTAGRDVETDDEIVISEGYAVNQNIAVGDTMKIGDKSYTVTGYFQRPDYLYMLENEDDTYKNVTSFYLCVMTDSAFEALGDSASQYLVRYRDDNSADFRRHIHEEYIMHSYSSKEENPRITMVDEQAQMFVAMAYIILCVLPLIAVALVSIIISRKVKSEQRMIGTLSAMGYKKGQLMRHYAGFAALPGLLGGVLTAVLSMVFAQPYSEMGLQDYEPMRVQGHLSVPIALLGVAVPTAMYVLAALLAVRRLLKKDTVLLLAGNADGSDKKRKRILADKNISFRKKYALRALVGNPARSFVVLLGVFLGSFIMMLGFSVVDTVVESVDTVVDSLGSYEYEYVLNTLTADNPYGGEMLLVSALEDKGGRSVTLIGTAADNPYLNLQDSDKNPVDIGDGYYITSLMATIDDVQQGDTITLYNPLSLNEMEITVDGILQNDTMKAVFTSPENAAAQIGVAPGLYNALVSDVKLDIPQDKLTKEVRKSSLTEQMQTILDQMDVMIGLLIGLGVLICVASIYVAVDMLVAENRSNISMLKVLGYRDRQIDRIVLSVNHIFLPIGILLGIPAAYSTCNFFYRTYADMMGMLFKAKIAPLSYVLTILLTASSYFASLALARRKVKKVDMIESLKDNRE